METESGTAVGEQSELPCLQMNKIIYLAPPYYVNSLFQAIETFSNCTKKESKMAGAAATNLSFIFHLVIIFHNYLYYILL